MTLKSNAWSSLLFVFMICIALISGCQSSDRAPVQDPPADTDTAVNLKVELQMLLDHWLESTGVDGGVLAIVDPAFGNVAVAGGSSQGHQVSTDDRFHVFSLSKTFTAAAVLQLAEEGILSLDESLDNYIPDFPNSEIVTIRQILTHTSGYPDFYENPEYFTQITTSMDQVWTWQDTLPLAASLPLHDQPGQSYYYSNVNYVLLAGIIEEATGNSYASELRSRFFDPLGLENTYVRGFEEIPGGYNVGKHDCSYVPQEALDLLEDIYGSAGTCIDGYIDGLSLPRAAVETVGIGGDGIVSNAQDILTWAKALFEGNLLSEETMLEMRSLTKIHPSYGMGIDFTESPLGDAWGHPGGGIDGEAKIWYVPSTGTYIAAFANRTGGDGLGELVDQTLWFLKSLKDGTMQTPTEEGLFSSDSQVRAQTLDSLLNQSAALSDETVSQILLMLKNDPDSDVRSAAARLLGPVGNKLNDEPIFEALVHASQNDASAEVRSWAYRAMAFYGRKAIPYIEVGFNDSSEQVVSAAEESLRFANR